MSEDEARYRKLADETRKGLEAAGRLFSLLEEQGVDGEQLCKFWADWRWPVECDVPATLEQLVQQIEWYGGDA